MSGRNIGTTRVNRNIGVMLFLLLLVLLPALPAGAAQKNPTGVTLNKRTATLVKGKTLQLQASVKPANNVNKALKWKSSDPKVAAVSDKGFVRAINPGTAVISVTTVNQKKATCKVMVKKAPAKKNEKSKSTQKGKQDKKKQKKDSKTTKHRYKVTKTTVTFESEAGTRTYRRCFFKNNKYPGPQNCVVDSVAFAVSGFGKKVTPFQLHYWPQSKAGSEKHALKKLKMSGSYWNRTAISVCVAAQMIRDMGIPAKAVYTYKTDAAVKQIQEHLKAGKPVILKCNNHEHAGHWITQGHHTIVLLGLDTDGTVTFYDAMYNHLNWVNGTKTTIREGLRTLISQHTTSCKGKTRVPFVTSLAAAGGYILVG